MNLRRYYLIECLKHSFTGVCKLQHFQNHWAHKYKIRQDCLLLWGVIRKLVALQKVIYSKNSHLLTEESDERINQKLAANSTFSRNVANQ